MIFKNNTKKQQKEKQGKARHGLAWTGMVLLIKGTKNEKI
jgi:hypothetical protein